MEPFTADILTCQSRKSTDATNIVKDSAVVIRVPESHDSERACTVPELWS